jgi:hypothetical protein
MAKIKQCAVIAGPKKDVISLRYKLLEQGFGKVIMFPIPDDYGEFPDVTDPGTDNLSEIVLEMEDPNLYPIMLKCVDAAEEWREKKEENMARKGFVNIKSYLQGPKFGGKIYVVIATVTGRSRFELNRRLVKPPTAFGNFIRTLPIQ